jgi:hypothetical protein
MDGVKSRGSARGAWRKCRWHQVAQSARSVDIRAHPGLARSTRVPLDAVAFAEDRN